MKCRTPLVSLVVVSGLTLLGGPLVADPVFDLRLFNTDDRMQAFVTNSIYTSQLILSNDFLGDTGFVDVSSFLTSGINTIALRLTNAFGGYTYGYELRQDGGVIDQGSCGTVGVLGCNGNDSAAGNDFTHTSTFGLPALPTPDSLRLRLFNTDDTLQAFVTNSSFTDELMLSNTFLHDTGFVDISSYTRPGSNRIDLSLTNTGGGYTYGFQFLDQDFAVIDEAWCGTANVIGCNDNNLAKGTVFTHTLNLGHAAPEPTALLLLGAGLIGLAVLKGKSLI